MLLHDQIIIATDFIKIIKNDFSFFIHFHFKLLYSYLLFQIEKVNILNRHFT
jgi:hypothetical protein